ALTGRRVPACTPATAPARRRGPAPRAAAAASSGGGGGGARAAQHPAVECSSPDELELTVHLAARWLPFEKETAAEALRLSRALISPRTSGRSVARAAVPFYRAL
ncbi:hypothetical protein MNEG_15613, partial [Monoraphidium neglectum]